MSLFLHYLSLPYLLEGIELTLQVTALGLIGGLILGLILAWMQLSRFAALAVIARGYTVIFRGTPLILQMVFAYDALPHIGIKLPAIAAAGIPLDRLFLLHPKNDADELWALTESLRCCGVGAALACPKKLSTIEARRLQLAAERGGGVGLLLRPMSARATPYAAATRWLVASIAGERNVQKWKLQLIHGHGGQVGKSVILEARRATNSLRVLETVADRQVPAKKARSA